MTVRCPIPPPGRREVHCVPHPAAPGPQRRRQPEGRPGQVGRPMGFEFVTVISEPLQGIPPSGSPPSRAARISSCWQHPPPSSPPPPPSPPSPAVVPLPVSLGYPPPQAPAAGGRGETVAGPHACHGPPPGPPPAPPRAPLSLSILREPLSPPLSAPTWPSSQSLRHLALVLQSSLIGMGRRASRCAPLPF